MVYQLSNVGELTVGSHYYFKMHDGEDIHADFNRSDGNVNTFTGIYRIKKSRIRKITVVSGGRVACNTKEACKDFRFVVMPYAIETDTNLEMVVGEYESEDQLGFVTFNGTIHISKTDGRQILQATCNGISIFSGTPVPVHTGANLIDSGSESEGGSRKRKTRRKRNNRKTRRSRRSRRK